MKTVWSKIRWLYKQASPATFFISFIVLLGVASSLGMLYRASVLKYLFDASTNAQTYKMIKSAILLAFLIFGEIFLRAIISSLTTRSCIEITNNIQKKLYIHFMESKWLEFSKYHSGDILTRLTSDVDIITNLLVNTFPNVLSSIVLLSGSIFMVIYYAPNLAILVILIVPITLLSRFISHKMKKLYTHIQQVESSFRSFLNEAIQNMVIIKAFCAEKNSIEKITFLQNNRLKFALSRNFYTNFSNTVFSLGSWLVIFIIYCWGSYNISRGAITFGTLTALLQLFSSLIGPISGLAGVLPQVIAASASAERLIELEKLKFEAKSSVSIGIHSVGIQLENITFGYTMTKPILKNLSTSINPGETVAIIGPSGEGKTTLIRLILSLIEPTDGKVYMEYENRKIEITSSCRNSIAYVPQGNTLFSGTIAENLKIGKQNSSFEEMESAARAACAWEFICNLKNGLNTVIGERGVGFSEGQAQRLAIARALLKKSPILILDEATSALDMETELKVLQTIKNLEYKPTCLIITHRPSALAICDRVLKLENGELFEVSNVFHKETAVGNV